MMQSLISMEKHMRIRCGKGSKETPVPARLRAGELYAECALRGVRTIYDLPAEIHIEHRARRLMGACS